MAGEWKRLKGEFDLPPSHVTIGRILRAHGLLQKRRRKYQRTQDVAQVKACWRLFQQLSADTKDLQDSWPYWPQAQRLPLIQYAAGEVRSGLLFLAFAQRRSASASAVFATCMQRHLARYGVELRHLVWQTDNGTEFIGGHDERRLPGGSGRVAACAHPARRPYLQQRCRNRPARQAFVGFENDLKTEALSV